MCLFAGLLYFWLVRQILHSGDNLTCATALALVVANVYTAGDKREEWSGLTTNHTHEGCIKTKYACESHMAAVDGERYA